MTNYSQNNKRIAKNTIVLYIRMIVMMIISFYTSRVILNALGVTDYGIYGVVGAVVSMFSIISSSLSAAISRYITFELGKKDTIKLRKIFSTALNIQLFIILIVILFLETLGVWFLNNKMTIPIERLYAANWVFQFSIITFAINLWCIPYNAIIIAYERMSAFAYISIFDAIAKLAIAFIILNAPFDRLIFYGALILIAGIIQRICYTSYCKRHFNEYKYEMKFDKAITKEMFGFASWNFIGASSAILRDQGGNILINLFYGPNINAARSIAMSINSAVHSFVSNFMLALNPQITKNYASRNFDYMFKLTFQGARLSYYILLILSLPIIFTMPYLLYLWLGNVPEYTSNFAILILFFSMSESLASPLITVMLATGKIKNYQLVVGSLQLLNLPLSYIGCKLGFSPEIIFIVAIIVSIVCEFARLIMLKRMIGLSIKLFLKDVYINVILVTIFASIIPFIIKPLFKSFNLLSFVLFCIISIISVLLSIYIIGCSKKERNIIKSYIFKLLTRFK